MIYKVTIIERGNRICKNFSTIMEAVAWADSQNNNLEATTIIESFNENGSKADGFVYTEKAK